MNNEHNLILKIALATPLRKTFDYLPPLDVDITSLKIGTRIRVPFGKRETIGVYVANCRESALHTDKLKRAIAILDAEPLFTPQIMSLYDFASQYYHHPIGEVVFSSLPPLLREGSAAELPEAVTFILTASGGAASLESLKHAIHQQKLIALLKEQPNGLSREELLQAGVQHKALTALLAKGYVRKQASPEAKQTPDRVSHGSIVLNEYQQQAITTINSHEGFNTFLLEGVTGSGKTEVYLRCIDHVLKKNKQALVLVPEIGLTPQTVARFQSRFNVPISILHSNLNDKQRMHAWISALRGTARIIIGTRSAVLTPLPQLGIIILDEEHDSSFKQQSGFRYSAKDLAIMRGKLEDAPVILGSATPCLESLFNVKQKRFKHLVLPERAGTATPPSFHIVDVRNKSLKEGFSLTLLDRMKHHLSQEGQILIFLNRRGFAPTVLCHQCGWTATCSRCDARYTYHSELEKLVCHHCAVVHNMYKRCEGCHSHDLLLLGLGTQRLEKILSQHFPGIPLTRIDRDSTRRKGSMEQMLSSVHAGKSQILLGTQMLAKGHHFPNVTMAAIIDIDNSLYSSDFRASERLGQLIVQVAGRAGRADRPGEVYLQTHNPEHPLLGHLIHSGYSQFANLLLNERKSAHLPPYSHLALFRAEGKNIELAENFLNDVKKLLLEGGDNLEIYGPIPALMAKKAGKFRAQLLVQTKQRRSMQSSLSPAINSIPSLSSGRSIRWTIDIDPLELY